MHTTRMAARRRSVRGPTEAAAMVLLVAATVALVASQAVPNPTPGVVAPVAPTPKPPAAKPAVADADADATATPKPAAAVLPKPAAAAAPKPAVTPAPKPAPAPKAAADGAAAAAASAGSAPVPSPTTTPPCQNPCYTVADYWPYKTCRAECAADVCKRGWGVWTSQELCCSAGAAFPDGCSVRPKACWVAENPSSRTCWRDDRKCLQGYGVWPSEEACCAPGMAFPDGCKQPDPAAAATATNTSCWVIDTYFPSRLCRSTPNLCAPSSGVTNWPTKQACCAKGAAFTEGCSAAPPPTPCYTVGSYWPSRTCVTSDDIAVCNRGWGVYASEEICCTPNVAFSEGCSPPAAAADSAAAPAAAAAAATPAAAAPAKPAAAVLDPDSLK